MNEHIRVLQHSQQNFTVFRVLDIQRDRLLAAIQPSEIGAFAVCGPVITAREITCALTFDLDYTRAGIGQPGRAKRCGNRLFERNDEFA